jgi:hypothetical protein
MDESAVSSRCAVVSTFWIRLSVSEEGSRQPALDVVHRDGEITVVSMEPVSGHVVDNEHTLFRAIDNRENGSYGAKKDAHVVHFVTNPFRITAWWKSNRIRPLPSL